MSVRISFDAALRTWKKGQTEKVLFLSHLSDAELNRLNQSIPKRERQKIIDHLILCDKCSQKLKFQSEYCERNAVVNWDTSLRKAAATGKKEYPMFITTQNGNYKLEIRQSETQPNSGIIILYVQDKLKAELEGKTVSAVDGKGRTILKGIIKQGELFQMIDDLDNIDESTLLIRPIE